MADDQKAMESWANTVAYANSYRTVDTAVDGTGFRTNELLFRTLSLSSQNRCAEEFLVASRLGRNDWESEASVSSYFSDPTLTLLSMRGQGRVAEKNAITLPPSVPLLLDLDSTLSRRRSHRQYTGDSMSLEYLATVLRAGGGISGLAEPTLSTGEQVRLDFRTHGSAGGLYPTDMYVLATNVESLPRGIYRYDPHHENLIPQGDDTALDAALAGFAVNEEAISIRRSGAIILMVAQPWRTMRKYGTRGLRFVFIEAGAIAQNIALAVAALGYGAVECAATYDDEIHSALDIDGHFRALTHAIIIGCIG